MVKLQYKKRYMAKTRFVDMYTSWLKLRIKYDRKKNCLNDRQYRDKKQKNFAST